MDQVIVWSGWIAGLAVGGYLLLQLWVTGKPLACSTGFGNACVPWSRQPYFRTEPYGDPWNWRTFFLLGLPIGGFVAVATSPGAAWVPGWSYGALYDGVMPEALWARALIFTTGGIAIGYGARLAGGCTSGHSISGMAMLNPPSIIASVCFFVGGIVSVQLLFRLTGAV